MLSAASFKNARGYTMVEMIIVGALVITGSVIAIPVTMRMVQSARGDSAQVMAATFLQSARNRAVAERRNIVITFTSETTITAERIEVPDGTLTLIDQLILEGDSEFIREGLPDTPDRFGGLGAVNFSGITPVMFTSDGSLIDSAGDVCNGTIYVARPNNLDTARAITIAGVTGMLRSYRWGGTEWLQ